MDGPFLAHVTGITPSSIAGESPDCVLWTQVASSGSERADDRILAATTGHSSALAMHLRESGIEIWTETELACLHALTWLGPAWEARALAAARFLIDELQPDNGTNHPWAIHWFAWLESTQSNTDAGLYAQSLLHNAMTSGGGVPDLFSAIILHDAARWIEDRLAAC